MRGSKKVEKICTIPDRWEEDLECKPMWEDKLNLSLHQRLGLFVNYLHRENSGPTNLVVANIGFVISSEKWKKNGSHTRRFVTIPLVDDKYEILGQSVGKKTPTYSVTHSESGLISYLNNNISLIVAKLKLKYEGHKIYTAILDLHLTFVVCTGCTVDLMELQGDYKKGSFLYKLQFALNEAGFVLPKKSLDNQYLKIKFPDQVAVLTKEVEEEKLDTTSIEFNPDTPFIQLIVRASGFNRGPENYNFNCHKSEYYQNIKIESYREVIFIC